MNQKYEKHYSEESFFNKIIRYAKSAGIKVIYVALLLYYTLKKPSTPPWAKTAIIGALGYFIFPIDLIPDILPGVGYVDDLSVMAAALATVAAYIDDEVREQAKEKLKDWFGDFDEKKIQGY